MAGNFLRDRRVSVCPDGQLPLLLPSKKGGTSYETHLPSYSSQNYALPWSCLKLAREERAFLSKLAQNMISQPRVRIQPFVDSLSPNGSWTYEHVRISSHERIVERIVFHQN